MKAQKIFLILILLLALLPAGAQAQDVVYSVADSVLTMTQATGQLKVPYYANHPLGEPNADITRLIFVVHGTLRNADSYYESILDAANQADLGNWQESTLVISPQFLTSEDLNYNNLGSQYAYWQYMGWRKGDLSRTTGSMPRPWRVSSYAVADTFIQRAVAVFPNLQNIVLAGHSAGGQFVNRHAAGSSLLNELTDDGINIRGIVSNPSTYMYMSPKRKTNTGVFAVPSPNQISNCPGYDNYKYGMVNLNDYMDSDPENLRENYRNREIIYLLGALDNQIDFYLDTSCSANFQGSYRLVRGQNYLLHLVDEFGSEIRSTHREVVVPGIGHDHDGIFASACGVRYLFDEGLCHDAAPECSVLPGAIDQTLAAGQSETVMLSLANTGEPGSIVSYNLLLNDPVPLPTANGQDLVLRNLTGSTVSASPNGYEPGGTLEVVLTVTNHSNDDEYIAGVDVNFPTGISIISATSMSGSMGPPAPYSGQLGDGATASWNNLMSQPGQSATATLVLEFVSVGGNVSIPYEISGDGFGSPPHSVSGDILFEPVGPFVQLVSPNGGEVCRQNDLWPIQLVASNDVQTVDVYLKHDAGVWNPLFADQSIDSGSIPWLVAGELGEGYSMRVVSSDNAALADTSEASFSIGRSLAWVEPLQTSGTVDAGETALIEVAINATGLLPATYQAEIVVENNGGSAVVVPVTLVVEDSTSPVVDDLQASPAKIHLRAIPNPFNPQTVLSFEISQEEDFELAIFDARGRCVRVLAEGLLSAGSHSFTWDGKNEQGAGLPSAIYFARLQGGQESMVRKLMLVR